MNTDFDKRVFEMAAQEKMCVPQNLEFQVNRILENKKRDRKIRYSFKRTVVLVAACTLMCSITVTAAANMYLQRMEAMNQEKLEAYFEMLYTSIMPADNYNRGFTDSELKRKAELETAYLEQGVFPKKELTILEDASDYKKGVAYLPHSGTFFFPKREMKDEELLQYIDFIKKRDYSLAKINEQLEAGELVLEQPVSQEPELTEESVLESKAIYEPGQALTIAYGSDMPVQCMTAGRETLFLGGYNRIECMAIGSDETEVFFDDFGTEEALVTCLYEAEDGVLYAGVSKLGESTSAALGKTEIYKISRDGELLQQFEVGSDNINMITGMAMDAEENLYVKFRSYVGENREVIQVYNKENEFLSLISGGEYVVHTASGIGAGEDGKVYACVQSLDNGNVGLAVLNPITGGLDEVYENLQAEGDNLPWSMVAKGVENDLILYGYDGVYTYDLGNEKAERIIAPYEAVCSFEGASVSVYEDGRMIFLNATEGYEITVQNGATGWVKNPEKTTIYYVPTIKE